MAGASRENTWSDMIATVNYYSSILLPWCQPTWTNALPRHFCRGPASHKLFDFLSSFYPFYMFRAAKTFSASRRVRNHYTKRTLNLTLNRKKFLRRGNDPLDKQKPRQIRRGKSGALHLLHQTPQVRKLIVIWYIISFRLWHF